MAKIRPDGSTWIRTYPVTFLHDHTEHRRDRAWHHLIFATRGHLEVVTAADDTRHVVPTNRALWVPSGHAYTAVMRAPISMRSLFVARGVAPALDRGARVRTLAVAPLLRELVLQATRLGALDARRPDQRRLALVIFDQLLAADDVGLELASPRDPRARAFAELIARAPGDPRSTAQLARAAGTSARTLERLYVAETGLGVGAWRRRVRLFHALRLLDGGAPVTAVALDVGYASLSAFTAAFARQFGYTPSGKTPRRTVTAGASRAPPDR